MGDKSVAEKYMFERSVGLKKRSNIVEEHMGERLWVASLWVKNMSA